MPSNALPPGPKGTLVGGSLRDPVILDFTPAALDTEALDDLVNLMLGQAQSISASRAVARLRPLTKL